MWKFAARYGFVELEKYCRSNAVVFAVMKDNLRNGVSLLGMGVPEITVNTLMKDLVRKLDALEMKTQLCIAIGCKSNTGLGPDNVCSNCKKWCSTTAFK